MLGSGPSNLEPVSPLFSRLCSGHRDPLADAHCNLLLLGGFLPFCPLCGCCELRGASPNLRFAGAAALGSQVSSMTLVSGFWAGASILSVSPRHCNRLPDAVFLDLASLPLDVRCPKVYWDTWTMPHVFFCAVGDTDVELWGGCGVPPTPPAPPRGWTECSLALTHCEAGGGTTGHWRIVVWYPPACPIAEQVTLTPQPWLPIRACVNDRFVSTLVPAVDALDDMPPVAAVVRTGGFLWVLGAKPKGVIQALGLFPASDLHVTVLLAASGSPSGWGTHALSELELAAIWDVPVLVSYSLSSLERISPGEGALHGD